MRNIQKLISAACIILVISLAIAVFSAFQENLNIPRKEKQSHWIPKRINKAIELLESNQPIYYVHAYGGYEEGKKVAQTWADVIIYDMEHNPLDFSKLREFMKGLVDGGPTPSGHRTPAVIVVLPILGTSETSIEAGYWAIQQALAQGVHGIHLARARDPNAVKKFIQAVRYPIHKQEINSIGEGFRGWGSHKFAAWVWGVPETTYLKIADPWPLNPNGEIMLGVKIEDPHALKNAPKTLSIPGLCFAEHGPRDFGLSLGYLEGRATPPMPKEVIEVGKKVLSLCKKYHLFFLDNVTPENVKERIDEGVMICAGGIKEAAEIGRKYTKREMPW